MKRKLAKDELEKIALTMWSHINMQYPKLQTEIVSIGEKKVNVNIGGIKVCANVRCLSQGKRIQSYIITGLIHRSFTVDLVWKYASNRFVPLEGTLRVGKGTSNDMDYTSFISGIVPVAQNIGGREADHKKILAAAMEAPDDKSH